MWRKRGGEQVDAIGRLLVLDVGHGLSVADIERLTGASNVQELAPEDSVEQLDEFVYELVSRWLEITRAGTQGFSFSAYRVEGETSNSMLVKLQAGQKFLLAVELDELRAQRLSEATYLACKLLSVQDLFNDVYHAHTELRKLLKRAGAQNTLERASKHLSAAHKQYGMDELRELGDSINEVMRHTW